jgi:bifunctional non-homologous end joining protein LigD
MDDPLKKYKSKRDFSITPEPAEGGEEGGEQLKFVIQGRNAWPGSSWRCAE